MITLTEMPSASLRTVTTPVPPIPRSGFLLSVRDLGGVSVCVGLSVSSPDAFAALKARRHVSREARRRHAMERLLVIKPTTVERYGSQ